MIISFIELLSPRYSSSKKHQLSWQLNDSPTLVLMRASLKPPSGEPCMSLWPSPLSQHGLRHSRCEHVAQRGGAERSVCIGIRLLIESSPIIHCRTWRGGTSPLCCCCCTSVLVNHIPNPFPPQMYLCHGNVILAPFIDHVTQLSI